MTDLELVKEARMKCLLGLRYAESMLATIESHLNSFSYSEATHKLWIGIRDSWLAHKAFFERHEGKILYEGDKKRCQVCSDFEEVPYETTSAPYPCPELIEQAKRLLGVSE